jgi:UDP-N-acetyl-2-amino-2-deoxyglucuronate dehydrogenase
MKINYALHTANIAAFLDALDGKTQLMLSAAEGRKAVAIIEAIYTSAATGKAVAV